MDTGQLMAQYLTLFVMDNTNQILNVSILDSNGSPNHISDPAKIDSKRLRIAGCQITIETSEIPK